MEKHGIIRARGFLILIELYVLQSVFGRIMCNTMYWLFLVSVKAEQKRHCEDMGTERVLIVHWEY